MPGKSRLDEIVALSTSAVMPLGSGTCGAQNQTSICSLRHSFLVLQLKNTVTED